ncbi:hypothetical protein ACVIHF_008724 [Bradyrhizobium sp. USDA 4506]
MQWHGRCYRETSTVNEGQVHSDAQHERCLLPQTRGYIRQLQTRECIRKQETSGAELRCSAEWMKVSSPEDAARWVRESCVCGHCPEIRHAAPFLCGADNSKRKPACLFSSCRRAICMPRSAGCWTRRALPGLDLLRSASGRSRTSSGFRLPLISAIRDSVDRLARRVGTIVCVGTVDVRSEYELPVPGPTP